MKRILLFTIAALMAACTEEQGGSPAPVPVIKLDSPTSVYTAKTGHEILIAPTYEHADDATFAWRSEGATLGTEPTLRFRSEQTGRHYLTLTVTNSGGSAEEELRIDVVELDPPRISLPGAGKGFTVAEGSDLELYPQVSSSLETTCAWEIDGEQVSAEKAYTFHAAAKGEYRLRFSACNADGEDAVEFTVKVCGASEVDFKWTFEQTDYYVSAGRTIRLRALDVENAFDAEYTWKIDGETVRQGTSPEYVFHAGGEGVRHVKLEMRNSYVLVSQPLTVTVCPAEGAYYRPRTTNRAECSKVYEYLPAPGQFINEGYTAAAMSEACAYAESRFAQKAYVSLGGFGGCVVVGFDHSIDNDEGYNLAITGNAFKGSSEPGIVWVMQDENGDGLPNDTWYELKGSEYGKVETISDYAVTYYRPAGAGMAVQWTDNRGGRGEVDYLGAFHTQDSYYPLWIAADRYTLRGTCLKARNHDASGEGTLWINEDYDWGYADNFSSIDRLTDDANPSGGASDNHFRICDAVTFDGRAAGLKYIDFVKIQTGVNAKSGWIGELSPEIYGVADFNMTKSNSANGQK